MDANEQPPTEAAKQKAARIVGRELQKAAIARMKKTGELKIITVGPMADSGGSGPTDGLV